MTYQIIYRPNSVEILTQKTVKTIDGREIPDGPAHGEAIGIGDVAKDHLNPTQDEIKKHKARVKRMLERHLGVEEAAKIGESHFNQLMVNQTQKEAQRQLKRAEKAEDAHRALQAEFETARDELRREKIARQAIEVEIKRATDEIRVARNRADFKSGVDAPPVTAVPAKPLADR